MKKKNRNRIVEHKTSFLRNNQFFFPRKFTLRDIFTENWKIRPIFHGIYLENYAP